MAKQGEIDYLKNLSEEELLHAVALDLQLPRDLPGVQPLGVEVLAELRVDGSWCGAAAADDVAAFAEGDALLEQDGAQGGAADVQIGGEREQSFAFGVAAGGFGWVDGVGVGTAVLVGLAAAVGAA